MLPKTLITGAAGNLGSLLSRFIRDNEPDLPLFLMEHRSPVPMVDAAKWFAKRRLLGVWRETTQIHLISKTDFCRATLAAIQNRNANGIYHVGDEGNDTLQSFLDLACDAWGYHRPMRMP